MTEAQVRAIRGAEGMLRESAKQHRLAKDSGHASMCDLHADALDGIIMESALSGDAEALADVIGDAYNWSAGDELRIRAHRSDPGRGLSYAAQTLIAVEDGAAGGWDVYEGHTSAGDVSFYGFSVENIRKRTLRPVEG